MLNIARKHIESEKLKGEINFVHDDYVTHQFNQKFDAACLMGFFDYIKEPKNLLLKLKKDITQEIYGSFPKSSGILAAQRIIRYKMRNCPLYLYSKQEVESLMNEAGFNNYEIMSCKRDWFVRVRL